MTDIASGTSYLTLKFTLTRALDLGKVVGSVSRDQTLSWTQGVGRLMIRDVFQDTRTLGAAVSETLDFYAGTGSQTNPLGDAFSITGLKLLYIEAPETNDGNIEVGGGSSNILANWVKNTSDIVLIRPGGSLLLTAIDETGYTVSSSSRYLQVANAGAATGTYSVIVAGS